MSSRDVQVFTSHDITVYTTKGTLRWAGEKRKGEKRMMAKTN